MHHLLQFAHVALHLFLFFSILQGDAVYFRRALGHGTELLTWPG